MIDYGLDRTVHVGHDGSITRDIEVPHKGANVQGDNRIVAAPMRVVHSLRFAPGGIPAGVNQHLPCKDPDGCATCRLIDRNTGTIL